MGVDLLPGMQGDKAWSPDKWSPRHRLIIALHLGGDRNNDIARKLSVTPAHVSVVLNDPRAIHEIMRMSEQVADRTIDTALRLRLYSNEALDEIIDELRTSRSEKVRQTAAFGILDRAGFTPVRDGGAEAPVMSLPESVVERMEAATHEIVQSRVEYKNLPPEQTQDEEPDLKPETELGGPRGPESND